MTTQNSSNKNVRFGLFTFDIVFSWKKWFVKKKLFLNVGKHGCEIVIGLNELNKYRTVVSEMSSFVRNPVIVQQ